MKIGHGRQPFPVAACDRGMNDGGGQQPPPTASRNRPCPPTPSHRPQRQFDQFAVAVTPHEVRASRCTGNPVPPTPNRKHAGVIRKPGFKADIVEPFKLPGRHTERRRAIAENLTAGQVAEPSYRSLQVAAQRSQADAINRLMVPSVRCNFVSGSRHPPHQAGVFHQRFPKTEERGAAIVRG